MAPKFSTVEPGIGYGELKLDLPRQQALDYLKRKHVRYVIDEDDPERVAVAKIGIELLFSDDEDNGERLQQIALIHPELPVNGMQPIGKSLDQSLLAFGIESFEDTLWRQDESLEWSIDQGTNDDQPKAANVTAENLLISGTLWIHSLGLGLRMKQGVVHQIFMRRTEDVPTVGICRLTESHLQVAIRDDLPIYLTKYTYRPDRASWLYWIGVAALVIAAGFVANAAIRDQQRWRTSMVAEGKVIGKDEQDPTLFVIEYQDSDRRVHQVKWTILDMYVPPAIGDTVDVHYLIEAPDQPLGPARVRDVTFLKYTPHVVGLMVAFTLLQFFDSFLHLFRRRRK